MADHIETPGDRLYLIRLACGDGKRTAEPMKEFVARVRRVAKATYHANAISLLERGEQEFRLRDLEALALVDPLKRGAQWLAFGGAARPAAHPQTTIEDEAGEMTTPPAHAPSAPATRKIANDRPGKRGRGR